MSTATKQLWICDSCGFVYDTDVGDPDGGIPPGTAFEDIPKDWPSAALERPTSGHSRQARRELGHLAPRVPP